MRCVALASALCLATLSGCRTDGKGSGPPVPASSDPEGKDLVVGAIVIAYEKPSKSYRLYKVKEVNYFPPPVGDELVMIAYSEVGNDFQHASDLWRKRDLSVAIPNVRVAKHMFMQRDYRVIENEPVTDADRALKAEDRIPARN